MGMFDELRCERELPAPNAQDFLYQFKDMDWPYMEQYVIRADGTLWKELYDTEDHSDPDAEGLMALKGCMARVNRRWEQCADYTGEIRFYKGGNYNNDAYWWLEFSAYFKEGQLQQLNLLQDTRAAQGGE